MSKMTKKFIIIAHFRSISVMCRAFQTNNTFLFCFVYEKKLPEAVIFFKLFNEENWAEKLRRKTKLTQKINDAAENKFRGEENT